MDAGSAPLNYESLPEKFLALEYEVLHRVIDKDSLLKALKSCIPNSGSLQLLLMLTSPCAEMNVPPPMIALEELKNAISTTGMV